LKSHAKTIHQPTQISIPPLASKNATCNELSMCGREYADAKGAECEILDTPYHLSFAASASSVALRHSLRLSASAFVSAQIVTFGLGICKSGTTSQHDFLNDFIHTYQKVARGFLTQTRFSK
jgi:hypothetical protein